VIGSGRSVPRQMPTSLEVVTARSWRVAAGARSAAQRSPRVARAATCSSPAGRRRCLPCRVPRTLREEGPVPTATLDRPVPAPTPEPVEPPAAAVPAVPSVASDLPAETGHPSAQGPAVTPAVPPGVPGHPSADVAAIGPADALVELQQRWAAVTV